MEQDGNVYSCSSMTGAKFWCGLDDWKPGDTDDCQMAWTLWALAKECLIIIFLKDAQQSSEFAAT